MLVWACVCIVDFCWFVIDCCLLFVNLVGWLCRWFICLLLVVRVAVWVALVVKFFELCCFVFTD